jgi:hypothetical protein
VNVMAMTKEQRVIEDIRDALEDIGYRYDSEDPDMRMMLVQLAVGIGLATVLEKQGLWKFLRTVFGAIAIRFKSPGLVDV